jgi:hypothetical protein
MKKPNPSKATLTRSLVAGGIAAAGLTVGGMTMANAETASVPAGTATYTVSADGRRGPGGPDGADGVGGATIAKALAAELNLKEAKVADALDAARNDVHPDKAALADGDKPTPPTDAERAADQKAFAAALAKELGISSAKVAAALDAVRSDAQAAARKDFAARLDTAVTAGDLTAADKASVLKAFDAGVLDGGPGGPGGFGHRIG